VQQQLTHKLVRWPAVIKLHGDDALIFIADWSHFALDKELQTMYFQPQDMLIDSVGKVFKLSQSSLLKITLSAVTLSLEEVISLLRAHLANDGTCCVSKFYASSIAAAYATAFN
jgi:hypothetical protein